ncbi:MAG: hypothetical protein AAF283_13830 [Cyanobacteria bacterium P01_A01_bin.70]
MDTSHFLRHMHRQRFLWTWAIANLMGGAIISGLENYGLQFMATLILAGATLGALQGAVIRSGRFRWWPVVSAVGWIVGAFVMALSQGLYRPLVDLLYGYLGLWEVFWLNVVITPIPVLGMALAQSLLLARQGRPIGIWLAASLVGAVLQGATSAALCLWLCPMAQPFSIVVGALGWAAYGLLTGAAGMRLLVLR